MKSSGYFQVIPAKSHSSAKVSFYPHTEDSSGEVCTAYAAAYMSLEGQVSCRDHLVFGLKHKLCINASLTKSNLLLSFNRQLSKLLFD